MWDLTIIGGGIVGCATALQLKEQHRKKSILLIEKESAVCSHQSGRNSGVIHSGIYYKPGSFKAQLCRLGNVSVVEFCRGHEIPYEICGKLIVATREGELTGLEALYQRAIDNSIAAERIGPEEIKEIEPNAVGTGAIRIPSTGIVNFSQVGEKLSELFRQRGGEIRLGTKVERIISKENAHVIETTTSAIETRYLVNCAGLYSDRVAEMNGEDPGAKIVPFRGEYYELKPEKRHLIRALIYPVPNPAFPFLGVHFTKAIDGDVHVGPNAVLALGREGYSWSDIHLGELAETLTYPGFWKLARRHFGEGVREMICSLSKAAFVRQAQRLVPEIQEGDLIPCPSGVRAQAVFPDGRLVDDFLVKQSRNAIHVCNAPSPAATASLEIGRHVASMVELT